MIDVFGRQLSLGDTVAVNTPGGHNSMSVGIIMEFTPKCARVKVTGRKKWNGDELTTLRNSSQLCFIQSNPDIEAEIREAANAAQQI